MKEQQTKWNKRKIPTWMRIRGLHLQKKRFFFLMSNSSGGEKKKRQMAATRARRKKTLLLSFPRWWRHRLGLRRALSGKRSVLAVIEFRRLSMRSFVVASDPSAGSRFYQQLMRCPINTSTFYMSGPFSSSSSCKRWADVESSCCTFRRCSWCSKRAWARGPNSAKRCSFAKL